MSSNCRTAAAKVDPAKAAAAIQVAGLPLHAELVRIVLADLDNQAFDHHLSTALIQLIDDLTQIAIQRLRSGNQQGVGGRISLNGHPCGTERGVLFGLLTTGSGNRRRQIGRAHV